MERQKAKKLREKLRLTKSDKKYLELDEIRTFMQTDLQFDDALRTILEDCGCGHLFRIWKEPPKASGCRQGYANEIRKYLGIVTQ
jgi:hypothetical protein